MDNPFIITQKYLILLKSLLSSLYFLTFFSHKIEIFGDLFAVKKAG